MATELGQAYVQIMPSAKGISGAIQNAIAPEASAAGKSAGSIIKGSKFLNRHWLVANLVTRNLGQKISQLQHCVIAFLSQNIRLSL